MVKTLKCMLMWYFAYTDISPPSKKKKANKKLTIAGAQCSVSKVRPSNNKCKLCQHADFISTELQTFNYAHKHTHSPSHSQIRLFRLMGAEIWSLI